MISSVGFGGAAYCVFIGGAVLFDGPSIDTPKFRSSGSSAILSDFKYI
jgi:hypothetical protein